MKHDAAQKHGTVEQTIYNVLLIDNTITLNKCLVDVFSFTITATYMSRYYF